LEPIEEVKSQGGMTKAPMGTQNLELKKPQLENRPASIADRISIAGANKSVCETEDPPQIL
jgi:hypothetical protein